MKRSRFTEELIIGILKEQEVGLPTAEVCRKHGISSVPFYKYKAKYGGMDVSGARKLKALEDENAKLKKLLAETMLDVAILKDVASKNGDAPSRRRSACLPGNGRETGRSGSCLLRAWGEPVSGVFCVVG